MKQFTILVGKSASGKDTILQQVLKLSNYKPIVSTTSRPKRNNEKEGVDYYYVSKEQFKELIADDELIEYREYHTLLNNVADTWYYGIQKRELDPNTKYITILDLNGARSFIDYYGADKCELLYIYCDDEMRKERAKKRPNFDETEWNRRLEDDEKALSLTKFVVDFYDVASRVYDNVNPNDYIDIAKEIIIRG